VDESFRGYPMDENKFIPASFAGLWIKLIVFLDESIRCNQMDENMLRKSSPPPTPNPWYGCVLSGQFSHKATQK
jgi:hypothetical protein